jgi:hypothetical protein
MEATP